MTAREPAFLRSLKIRKVALVESGANDKAEVVFFKSEDGEPSKAAEQTATKCPECGNTFGPQPHVEKGVCPDCGFDLRTKGTEKGTEMADIRKSDVYSKIVEVSRRIRETSPNLSTEQAITKASELRPDLVEQYREAAPDALDSVEETQAPGVLGGEEANKIAGKLHERATELATQKGVSVSKGYDLVFGDPEGQRLLSEYKTAQGDEETAAIYKSAAEWAGAGS